MYRARLIQIKAPRAHLAQTDSRRVRFDRGIGMNIAKSETSLYDRIGGAEGIANLVDGFYARVIADTELRPYFDHAPLDKLRRMQVEFFSAALDGPIRFTGTPVIHAHQGRHITRQHFQAFVEHLFDTLANFPLDENDRYVIIARINTYADDVIGSGTGPPD